MCILLALASGSAAGQLWVAAYRFAPGPPCTTAFADVAVPRLRPRGGR